MSKLTREQQDALSHPIEMLKEDDSAILAGLGIITRMYVAGYLHGLNAVSNNSELHKIREQLNSYIDTAIILRKLEELRTRP